MQPICFDCHKIRNDKDSSERLGNCIVTHSEAKFTHSICPVWVQQHVAQLK
jgi:hypothetical protein